MEIIILTVCVITLLVCIYTLIEIVNKLSICNDKLNVTPLGIKEIKDVQQEYKEYIKGINVAINDEHKCNLDTKTGLINMKDELDTQIKDIKNLINILQKSIDESELNASNERRNYKELICSDIARQECNIFTKINSSVEEIKSFKTKKTTKKVESDKK